VLHNTKNVVIVIKKSDFAIVNQIYVMTLILYRRKNVKNRYVYNCRFQSRSQLKLEDMEETIDTQMYLLEMYKTEQNSFAVNIPILF